MYIGDFVDEGFVIWGGVRCCRVRGGRVRDCCVRGDCVVEMGGVVEKGGWRKWFVRGGRVVEKDGVVVVWGCGMGRSGCSSNGLEDAVVVEGVGGGCDGGCSGGERPFS